MILIHGQIKLNTFMGKKLKVSVIGSCNYQQFPLIDYGGIESSVEHLCSGLYSYFKDEVIFNVIVPKIEKNSELTNQFNFKIIETNYVGCSTSEIHPINFALEAKKIIQSSPIKPDIIWAQGDWSAKGLYDLGIPIISTIQDSGPWVEGKYLVRDNVYYRFVSKFLYDLVLLDSDKREDVSLIKSKSFWAHTGLDDSEFIFEPRKENYILWVAGLHWGIEGKGVDVFIELAKRLPEEKFVAYGTGNEDVASYLKQVSSELPNFEFRGKLARGKEHKNVFKNAKFFVMFTRIPEAFGRTNIEALSKGTPVLGSLYGSIPELITEENAGICSNNIEDLIQVIKDNKIDHKKCYDYALEKFHIKHEINFLIKMSNKILNRNDI